MIDWNILGLMATAAVYTRISRDDAAEGMGVRRQEEDCLAFAARRDLTVTPTYVDNDVSANLAGLHIQRDRQTAH
jgi:DNA invertase Pin-like site-specific DNA recombinase